MYVLIMQMVKIILLGNKLIVNSIIWINELGTDMLISRHACR